MENQNFDYLLEKVSEQVKTMLKTETVIGDEFKLGEYTCKPVIRVGVGFGSGSGSGVADAKHQKKGCGEGAGAGAGAGMGIFPVGFLATKGDEISFIPTSGKKGLDTLFEKIPDIVDKINEAREKKEKES